MLSQLTLAKRTRRQLQIKGLLTASEKVGERAREQEVELLTWVTH